MASNGKKPLQLPASKNLFLKKKPHTFHLFTKKFPVVNYLLQKPPER
jgi:hypothetical protein